MRETGEGGMERGSGRGTRRQAGRQAGRQGGRQPEGGQGRGLIKRRKCQNSWNA